MNKRKALKDNSSMKYSPKKQFLNNVIEVDILELSFPLMESTAIKEIENSSRTDKQDENENEKNILEKTMEVHEK